MDGVSSLTKKIGLLILKVAVAYLALRFLIHSSLLKFDLLKSILDNPTWLMVATFFYILTILISAKRWQSLNSAQSIHLTYAQTLMPTYFGIAFNNVLPGAVGGDFVRGHYLFHFLPNQKSKIFLSIFVDRLMGLLGVFITVFIVAMIHFDRFQKSIQLLKFLLVCGIVCLVGSIVLIIGWFLSRKIGLRHWFRKQYPNIKSLHAFVDAIHTYKNSIGVMVKCIWYSFIIQLLMIVIVFLIAKMIGLPSLSMLDYSIAMSVTQIVNLIPVSPGGLGVGEAAFAKTLLLLNPTTWAPYATATFKINNPIFFVREETPSMFFRHIT